ncbi:carboxypeptidase regulatory-like domain-containing protein [[Pseudomonas] boreopolis]|uniref:Carboxypeptidase regulatory-like domain-containing protein n=1 Tax=Xanthomonas boreopolis TaxID=86183 RepID=A0A919KJM5_9XANT|nr:hypothetical protein GCM10009090_33580 [[Pseudomonas] boreopolis]
MTQLVLAAVLAVAALLAMWRLRRARVAPWKKIALLALQPACAALLYFALAPPPRAGQAGTLVVASAGSDLRSLGAAPGDRVVTLPEAPALAEVERVPDLATALRRHPGTQRLRIVGAGLPARDRDAAAGWPLAYAPVAPVPGLAELSTPPPLVPGAGFAIGGRVVGLPQASVELLDPAGRRVDRASIGEDGRFVLDGSARATGDVLFEVRVLDAKGDPRDRARVPVSVAEAPALELWLIAGAPQPELKYLRRWAHDAGLSLQTQVAVGGGLQLGDAPRPLEAATLDGVDLLIVDERALAGLGRGQRAAVRDAVARGLGLLVRIGGPLDAGARAALAELGMPLRGEGGIAPVRLPGPADASLDAARRGAPAGPDPGRDDEASPLPALERRVFAPAAAGAVDALRAADGSAYAWWRTLGRGRIGVTTLVDSYRLVLEGHASAHAALWSELLSPLARPKAPALAVAAPGWRDERLALCGLGDAAVLQAPDGSAAPLLRDPATGDAACAGAWPRQAGLYRWQDGERAGRVLVRDPAEAPALHANGLRAATLGLVREGAPPRPAMAAPQPGPRWPWWLAFVAASALLWWLERSRLGRDRAGTAR